jgi:predicted nucleic acid-binding protein
LDRLFLDANVLLSAAWSGRSGIVRALWDYTRAERVTSAYAVEEARRNLETSAQRSRLNLLLEKVEIMSEAVPTGRTMEWNLDPKDIPILAAAIEARATHLITGDQDFSHLFGKRVEGVLVLRPRDYYDLPPSRLRRRRKAP